MGLPVTYSMDAMTSPQTSGTHAPVLSRYGEVLALPAFSEWVRRGYGFCYSTALAGQEGIVAGTANAPLIANFTGSNVDLVIYQVRCNRTAVATPLEGGFTYLRENASIGAAVGTGAPIVSGTAVAAKNLLGATGGRTSAVTFYPTTVTATSGALLFFANIGFSQTADDGATTVSGPRVQQLIDYVDGAIVVPPGGALAIGAQVSTSATYSWSIFGLEIPRS